MIEPGWFYLPNIGGKEPAMAPPKDRLLIVRNLANRHPDNAAVKVMSEHLVFWDGTEFVRLQDDLFRDTVFTFFHLWREFEP